MMDEKVAIVIPCYNCGEFIEQTIESCLNQSYKNVAIITINDCSEDDTFDRLAKFKDDRIILLNNSCNLGASESRNIGIEKARELRIKYIQFLDSDDTICNDTIKEKLDIIKDKMVSMVYSEYYNMDKDGNILSYEHKPTFDYDRLTEDNYITCLSMHKTNNLIEVGGFDKYLTYCEDWDLALRVSKIGMPQLCQNAHFCYRINPKSQTRDIDWKVYGFDRRIVMTKLALTQGRCSTKDLVKAYNDKILYVRKKHVRNS